MIESELKPKHRASHELLAHLAAGFIVDATLELVIFTVFKQGLGGTAAG